MLTRNLLILSTLLVFAAAGCRNDEDDNNDSGKKDGGGSTTGDQNVVTEGGGGTTVETNIFKIMKGEVAKSKKVLIKGVVITAVDNSGTYKGDIYVQDPKGGAHSAIKLYRPTRADGKKVTDLKVGDMVNVEGIVKYWHPKAGEFKDNRCSKKKHIKELDSAVVTFVKSGTAPTPAIVTAKDLKDCTTADSYEHVLVTLKKVAVLTAEQKKDYFEITVSGGVQIGDDLAVTSSVKKDSCHSFTGMVVYFYAYRVHPRDKDDIKTDTGCPVTKVIKIKDIQDTTSASHPKKDDVVKVNGVVTAVDATVYNGSYKGFWIQDETDTGPYTGVYVYGYSWKSTDATAKIPAVGDKLEVTATYTEYYDLTELDNASFVKKGKVTTPIAPVKVSAKDVMTKGTKAEAYEGMLVEVNWDGTAFKEIAVGDVVADKSKKQLGFKDANSGLIIEAKIHDFLKPTAPKKGDKYKSIVGIMSYDFKERRLFPRSAADMKK